MEMETGQTILKRMHTREFKEEAVRRAQADPENRAAIARSLDLNSTMLLRWVREKESGHWDRKTWRRNPPGTQVATPKKPPRGDAPAAPATAQPNATEAFLKLKKLVDDLTTERDMLKATLAHYLLKG